jgi:hypothetical protein
MKTPIRIEILGFDGCPNLPLTHELIEAIVQSEGIEAKVTSVDVNSVEDAERLRFLGSPTVRVNGVDIEPSRQCEEQSSYSCRVYRTEDGTTGVPPEMLVRAALRNAWGT